MPKIYCSYEGEGSHALAEVGNRCPVCGEVATEAKNLGFNTAEYPLTVVSSAAKLREAFWEKFANVKKIVESIASGSDAPIDDFVQDAYNLREAVLGMENLVARFHQLRSWRRVAE